ncbi:MAG: TolC family protein [Elainellaceae cyanobacterium]
MGSAASASAQTAASTTQHSAQPDVSKPPSQKPGVWIAQSAQQSIPTVRVAPTPSPEAAGSVDVVGDRPLPGLDLSQITPDSAGDELAQIESPNGTAESEEELESGSQDNNDPGEPEINDEPEASSDAVDREAPASEVDSPDESPAGEPADESDSEPAGESDGEPDSNAESPSVTESNPLSQPFELDGTESRDGELESSDEPDESESGGPEDLSPAEPSEDFPEDAPSPLVQEVLEALDAPANPLFFPTDPQTVEVTETVSITLKQALQVAYRNSRELQSAQLQFEQAQAAVREALADRFPTLSATASYSRSTFNLFSDGLGTITADGTTTGGGNFTDLDSTFNGTVSLDYDLFTSGARQGSIRAARENRRLQALQLEVVAEDIQLNIAQAYYDIQAADEAVRISQSNLEEAEISRDNARAREQAGVGTQFDLLQAEVEVANARQEVRNAEADQLTTQRQLVDLLSLPPGITLTAAEPVEVAGRWQLSLEETLVLAYKNRAELEQQLVQRELDRQQRRVARASTLPQLSVSADYQVQDLLDATRSDSGDTDSFAISAQLSWLLFDGGASRAAARQESIDIEIAETTFADTRESIRFEVEEAFYDLESNFENIQTAAEAVGLAERSLELARLRLDAGVGIQSDVITAQSDLTEARGNRVTAILNYNRALVSIQRAVSNLPDNNLADIPPGNL